MIRQLALLYLPICVFHATVIGTVIGIGDENTITGVKFSPPAASEETLQMGTS